MSYYPKNRVKTNLYTEGKEYAVENTGQSYKGYYHKLYTGELFTGKTPSDLPVEKLIELPAVPGELHSDVNFTPVYTSEVAYGNLDYLNITNPSLAEKNKTLVGYGNFIKYFLFHGVCLGTNKL
jgi:hypothetical protein